MDELIESNGSCLEDLSKNLWMSSNEIMALSNDGHVIGLHTHTHPTNLASLDHKAQYRELSQNYEIIRDITGRKFLQPHTRIIRTMSQQSNFTKIGYFNVLQSDC